MTRAALNMTDRQINMTDRKADWQTDLGEREIKNYERQTGGQRSVVLLWLGQRGSVCFPQDGGWEGFLLITYHLHLIKHLTLTDKAT